MNSNLYIPERVNIGFNARSDTYTNKLAYIIYWDEKGVLRKETSWQNWRSKDIEPEAYDNKPLSGFVLNKKVGGVGYSSWNPRQTYSRIYDPRGFEFEITVPNLLFILENCGSQPGKALDGEFVYAWSGTELILLPVISQTYKESQTFTEIQGRSVKTKDYIGGRIYCDKSRNKLTYLGRWPYYNYIAGGWRVKTKQGKAYHIFLDDKGNHLTDVKIATCIQEEPVDNFGELCSDYYMSASGSPVIGMEIRQSQGVTGNTITCNETGIIHVKKYFYEAKEYITYPKSEKMRLYDYDRWDYNNPIRHGMFHDLHEYFNIEAVNGILVTSNHRYSYHTEVMERITPEDYAKRNDELYIKLESGAEIKYV